MGGSQVPEFCLLKWKYVETTCMGLFVRFETTFYLPRQNMKLLISLSNICNNK